MDRKGLSMLANVSQAQRSAGWVIGSRVSRWKRDEVTDRSILVAPGLGAPAGELSSTVRRGQSARHLATGLSPGSATGQCPDDAWFTGILAGIAGGGAEIAWIVLYSRLSGADAHVIAQGVTLSFLPGFSAGSLAVALGVAIHMGLAAILGMTIAVLLGLFLPRSSRTAMEPIAVVGLLLAVWATNFLIVLPAINPDFVELVPYGASLTSKLLFGVAAAFVLRFRH